jgi:hypothetical protein
VATPYSMIPFDADRPYKPLDHSEIGRPKNTLLGAHRRRWTATAAGWTAVLAAAPAKGGGGRRATCDDGRIGVFGVLFGASERRLGADGGGGRRRTPASNSDVCGALRGKPVKEGRYNKGKRVGGKEGSGATRTAGLSSKPSSNVGGGRGIRQEIRRFFDHIFLGFKRRR